MKKRKVPLRKCVGCGERKNKRELLRIVKNKEDEINVDLTGKMNGRGAYICNSTECLIKAKKNNGLNRNLNTNIPDEVYDRLQKEIESHGK
ncbi:RNase P modulator RnpM [Clostridiisalibacter paucivorans]|uniref:RNase P modulator RnpM n=1 Tax=Clostridiisalibacter paucivorans TaxID=408753 RepID=UPI00047C3445|nr:YlxR family protein [Clostridiisalibacter paucivorans]